MRTDWGALGRNAIALRQSSAKFSRAVRTRWDGVLRWVGVWDLPTASELNTDVSVHAIWNPREAQQDLMAVEYFCDHGLWEDEMFFLFTYP